VTLYLDEVSRFAIQSGEFWEREARQFAKILRGPFQKSFGKRQTVSFEQYVFFLAERSPFAGKQPTRFDVRFPH